MSKVICCADFHIGWKNANYRNVHKILDLVEEQKDDIELLVLNGDIIDLLRCKYSEIRKNKTYNDAFLHLKRVTEIVETKYVCGNHCILAPQIVGDDLNVDYCESYIHDNILFIHGHQFSYVQIYSVLAFITRHLNFIGKHINCGSAYISKSFHNKVDEFARANFYEYVILAHNHVPHVFRNVVYCGDMTQNPSFVEINENNIKIKKV